MADLFIAAVVTGVIVIVLVPVLIAVTFVPAAIPVVVEIIIPTTKFAVGVTSKIIVDELIAVAATP